MMVPSTYDEVIAALVELDVAEWGEAEREASERHHRSNFRGSYGLALNSLAHRPEYDFGDDAPELVARKSERHIRSCSICRQPMTLFWMNLGPVNYDHD